MRLRFLPLVILGLTSMTWADGPKDNIPADVRRIPKLGVDVPADKKAALHKELDELQALIDKLGAKRDPKVTGLLPDIQIFHQAVHDALAYQEFFEDKEIPVGLELLKEGKNRAEKLLTGDAYWEKQTGPVVRGYVSKLDGSVQPYGLVVPDSYSPSSPHRHRLDFWFHGRGETLSEVNFLNQRRRDRGQFQPADAIVLHPYGRYCNANKFAGEVDGLEALASVQSRYRIDVDRIFVRGFSMGGASAWHFAVHMPDRWAGANPGAGFSETPDFLKVFQDQTLQPTWWEKKLWRWYDCTDWASNLGHCPTVAYSGEIDKQKQAADIMATALEKHGIELVHIIGPQTAHKIHPDSARDVERRLADLAVVGRDRAPRTVDFTTYTLHYARCAWVTIEGMNEHWEKARVTGRLGGHEMHVELDGVTAFAINFGPGEYPYRENTGIDIRWGDNRQNIPSSALRRRSDGSVFIPLYLDGKEWKVGRPAETMRKKPGLQGPIDDAFMDAFIFVKPTGPTASKVEVWAAAELERAVEHWRRQFRGQVRVVTDTQVSPEMIQTMNLVLWGTPANNAVYRQIANKLPIKTAAASVTIGEQQFPADTHAPILIYPNPLNPEKYVVVNSSFTYRDFAYLNNARQVPMLPDWAVIDVTTPPNSIWPGKVVAADFFDERWGVKKSSANHP